jgi:hypothetical protein
MFRSNSNRLQAVCLIVLAVGALGWIVLALAVTPAQAQSGKPENDASCMSCHESLYLLYDTGKYYCFCGTRARCTYCHSGVLGALDKETAHQGLIAHPTQDNAAVCQSCHPDDYQQRVEKFTALGGIRPTPLAAVYTPPPASSATSVLLQPQPIEPWRAAGFSFLLVGFTGICIFAVRCYRDDCANHRI